MGWVFLVLLGLFVVLIGRLWGLLSYPDPLAGLECVDPKVYYCPNLKCENMGYEAGYCFHCGSELEEGD